MADVDGFVPHDLLVVYDMFEIPTDDDVHQRNGGYRDVSGIIPAGWPYDGCLQVS